MPARNLEVRGKIQVHRFTAAGAADHDLRLLDGEGAFHAPIRTQNPDCAFPSGELAARDHCLEALLHTNRTSLNEKSEHSGIKSGEYAEDAKRARTSRSYGSC